MTAALLEELVAELAAQLAPRVAAELGTPASPEAEPWRLVDVEEAAARLGRSTRWVRERAKRGDLPFVKLDGGALAFEVDDLRAFAASRRVAPLAGRLQAVRDPASGAGSRALRQVGDRRVSGG